MTPFQAVYGRLPPMLTPYEEELTNNAAAHDFLVEREKVMKELKTNLQEAQHRAKQMADRSRREVEFQVGDRVLVRLQPYRQLSLAAHTFSKLRRRFYGPFAVIKRVGAVAYKLCLPENSKIHSVFHVSRLKLFRQDDTLHPSSLPTEVVEGKPVITPISILRQRRVLNRQQEEKLQVLVEWEGLPIEEASWVNLQELRAAYPAFDLEGKVSLHGEGNVMPAGNHYRRRKTLAAELKEGNNVRAAELRREADVEGGLNAEQGAGEDAGEESAETERNAVAEPRSTQLMLSAVECGLD